MTPLREELAGKTRTALVVLLCASAALLLIACVNLANLLLSRGSVRGREVAVRAAIGAGRGRLVAQFLTESLVLVRTRRGRRPRARFAGDAFLKTSCRKPWASAAHARLARTGVLRRRRHWRRVDLWTCTRACAVRG